jgi:hypothetical protein
MAIDWAARVVAPCVKVFGEPITYRPASGEPYEISAVFDNAYREIDELTGELVPLVAAIPVVGAAVADFKIPPVQGDQLTVQGNGLSYVVKEQRADSHGHVLLKLNRTTP